MQLYDTMPKLCVPQMHKAPKGQSASMCVDRQAEI